ncbi:Y4yA family PLP-dependent enzyme [Brachybacterium vulturis]|uniref:Y4yA family PLP-dependent enzyme n=1 Tax=Brachybacterium vulturis TaxID=2017484 RepID=UPI0037365FE4
MSPRPDGAADPSASSTLRAGCRGLPPLTARLSPWMRHLLEDPDACAALVEGQGSPLNVHDFSALPENAAELDAAAREAGVRLGIFVARKANKTLGLVEAVRRSGLGLDVGSHRELEQALELGIPPSDIVVTAAIKPLPLLRLALEAGTTLVLDNLDEAAAAAELLSAAGGPAAPAIALRLAPGPNDVIAPTRFGESARTWREWAAAQARDHAPLRIQGVHFHLHGYDPASRAAAVGEAVELIDALRELGHRPRFLDIGGGIPMSYLDDGEEWAAFHTAHDGQDPDPTRSLTWRAGPLRQVYPYHQQPVRGQWLRLLLELGTRPGTTVAEELRSRELELRCEPGRSLLDGCGMTLARVIQRTTTSDGIPLVGLEMNRTQCRSTSDDFLVDPLLVRSGGDPSEPFDGFLVGAYCIEEELILRRRLHFPQGVAIGDLLALPNTAGYLMHILESASHQLPLASNVVHGEHGFDRDGIDAVAPQRPWGPPGR